MSIEMNQVNEVVVEKVMRTLPGKYSKFAGFAYWLLVQMKDNQILSGDAYDATCNMMNLLSGDLSQQIAFYERYLAEASVSSKLMKAEIKNRSKPVNAKAKEPKANANEPKAKKSKKVEQVSHTDDDILTQIVERANSVTVVDEPVLVLPIKKKRVTKGETYSSIIASAQLLPREGSVMVGDIEQTVEESKVEESKVVEKKKRVKKEQPIRISVVDEQELEEKVVVEKKKRVKKEKVPVVPIDELEEDIVLNAVSVDGIEYFYDADNRLYNSLHSVIGSFDPLSLAISISIE